MDIGPPASGKDNFKMSDQSSNERLLQEMQTALPQVPQTFSVFHFPQPLVPYSELQVGSKCTLDLCQKQSHGFFTPPHRVSVTNTHSLFLSVQHGWWENLSMLQLYSPKSILGRHQSSSPCTLNTTITFHKLVFPGYICLVASPVLVPNQYNTQSILI